LRARKIIKNQTTISDFNMKYKSKKIKKVIWIKSYIIDRFLHKAAETEIMKHLAENGFEVYLFAFRSKKRVQIINPLKKVNNCYLILMPFIYIPILSSILMSIIIFISLPIIILIKKPKFIFMEPSGGVSVISSIWKPIFKRFKCRWFLDIRSTPIISEGMKLGSRVKLIIFSFNISILIAKRLFNGITVVTQLMKEELAKRYNINPNFMFVFTNSISIKLFNPKIYKKSDIRKELGLMNKFIILYHGEFSYYRGLIECIESIKLLKKYKNLILFLLGKGSALPLLKNLIVKYDLYNQVIIHEAVNYEDIPKYISMIDVGIVPLPNLPDWRNQCPRKLLEYLSMKKVVIVTDIPCNREIIGDNRCGIYISSEDPHNISKAIEFAYINKKYLDKWGFGGYKIIKTKYTLEKVGASLIKYLLKYN